MNPTWQRLYRRLPERSRGILAVCVYGLGAGLSAVAFHWGIELVWTWGLARLSRGSIVSFGLGSFLVVMGTSLTVGWLLSSFCREAAGSGIPQLKLAYWKDFGFVPWRVAWVKLVAGVLSVGGGSSLGREGPSVQLAGAVSSNLAGWMGEPKQRRRGPAAAGAAAGLAAAFNTPLAATTFVLEEIIGDLNSRFLGSVLLASLLGAFVAHALIGQQPAFSLTGVEAPTWTGYALTPLVAAAASIVGVYFQRFSLQLRWRTKTQTRFPAWLTPGFGGLVTWSLGVLVFWRTGRLGVFGLGYDDLSSALAGEVGWKLAALLLAAKFVATICSYGFGGCGGIFSPTLFLGGMTGLLLAGLIGLQVPLAPTDTLALTVVGMSACLGAVVFAPVTGILIVFEMTHEFALVPALMLGALVSQAIGRTMNRENFYDSLLQQDGHQLEHVRPPRDLQGWRQYPVSALANFSPVVVTDLSSEGLQTALKSPYTRFPVILNGELRGIALRSELESAVAASREPLVVPATTCQRDQTVGELQHLLIQSTTQMVIVLDHLGGKPIGLVTLHDLLRAEESLAESAASETEASL